jgi:hypothetical protein
MTDREHTDAVEWWATRPEGWAYGIPIGPWETEEEARSAMRNVEGASVFSLPLPPGETPLKRKLVAK